MSEVDGIGEAVQGAMLAKAVEKSGMVDESGHTTESRCLNCKSPLDGPYCRQCGQRAHIHRSLGAFWHDLLHGVLHFEGKFWRTLPMAFFKPGELTRRYIAGERAAFLSPIAFFLFFVFLFFAVMSLTGERLVKMGNLGGHMSVEHQLEGAKASIAKYERNLAELDTDQDPKLQRGILRKYGVEDLIADEPVRPDSAEEREVLARRNLAQLKAERTEDVALLEQLKARGVERVLLLSAQERAKEEARDKSNDQWLNTAWRQAKKDPDFLAYKFQTSAYKFSWLLIPISVPLVWLFLFPSRKRFSLYDHTVFVTYSIAVVMLILSFVPILQKLQWAVPMLLVPILIPVHMAIHLKGAYQLNWKSMLWRLPMLYTVCSIALFVFVIALILIGIV